MFKLEEAAKTIQPYFVTATSEYDKNICMNNGIAHFYHYFQDDRKTKKVMAIPDGCVDVLFVKDSRGVESYVAGTVLEKTYLNNDDNKEYFGVRFLPGVLPAMFHISMKDLVSNEIPLEEIMTDKEAYKRLVNADSIEEWMQEFFQDYIFYENQKKVQTGFDSKKELADYVKNRILLTGGNVVLADLAEETHYSTRYLNRVMNEEVGVSPKTFGRIIKFQRAIQLINSCSELTLTDLCAQTGYYDQAHFIREFKKCAAMTPKEYRKLIQITDYTGRMKVKKFDPETVQP